jgi:hypothetical protein
MHIDFKPLNISKICSYRYHMLRKVIFKTTFDSTWFVIWTMVSVFSKKRLVWQVNFFCGIRFCFNKTNNIKLFYKWSIYLISIFTNTIYITPFWLQWQTDNYNIWQKSLCCRVIMNLVWSHNFANYTVVIMTLFAIRIYHWPIFIYLFHTLC